MHAIEVTRGISIDAIRLLVLAGADVNAIDKEGRTPLSFAMSQDRQDIIRVLLDAGVDPAPMRAAQQKALDDFLSGTMFHLEGLTVHQTLEVWERLRKRKTPEQFTPGYVFRCLACTIACTENALTH
jgi:ankyrin repeat protein